MSSPDIFRFLSSVEANAKAVSGNPELNIKWVESGVPYATPDQQITLIRPKLLDEQHEIIVLRHYLHECSHVLWTDWDLVKLLSKQPGYRWDALRAIWNGFEDGFVDHSAMQKEPGVRWLFRKALTIARKLGIVRTLDNPADWLPMAVIFHNLYHLRGWEEWSDECSNVLDVLSKATSTQQVEAFLEILNRGVAQSTVEASMRAREVYALFKDFIESQPNTASREEVVDFGKAVEKDRKRLEEGKPMFGDSKPGEGDPADEKEGEDSPTASAEGDPTDSPQEGKPGKTTVESDDPAESMSGGMANGRFYPPISRLRLPKSPIARECRAALDRFTNPKVVSKRARHGKINGNALWSAAVGNDRVFKKRRNVIDNSLPALGILLDISGSMGSQVPALLSSAMGIMDAYHRAKVPLGVWAFGLKSDAFCVVKDLHTSVDMGQARLGSLDQYKGGGSPMGAGLAHALRELDQARSTHKRMLIISDGDVDGMSSAQVARMRSQYPDITFMVVSLDGQMPQLNSVECHTVSSAKELPAILRLL